MTTSVSRRGVMAAAALAGTAAAAGQARSQGLADNPAGLKLLTSTDGVNTPPKAGGIQKFSFSNPEPSVEFAGLLFGFQIITFENNYGIDPKSVTVERQGDRLRLHAASLVWAGGRRERPGTLTADLVRGPDGRVEWTVAARMDQPVKAVKTIVRGLPRGRLSMSAEEWRDLGDDEKVFEYPALMGGMATPLMAIEGKDGKVWSVAAIQTEVRPARFAFLPGPDGYKVELVYEQAGWNRRGDVKSCVWRILSRPTFKEVAHEHFATVERNWALPAFQQRADAPDWAKHVALVLSLHGEHWTGYIHNDFDRQLAILKWAAPQIEPRHVMVFLAGWDARYYWDYPRFQVGSETGGEAAFARLIREGKQLGYRFALMFGSNVANPAWSGFPNIADAQIRTLYGDIMPSDYVDWDGDRKGEPTMVFMNLAVKSWRDHLKGRISDMVGRYGVDAYFLDICGLWENNPSGDMLLGARQLVSELAAMHPGVPAVAEMQYDAQMGFIPMNHVPRYPLYPEASYGVTASFNHLSWPAPGRGSTGVHEYGFNTYKPVELDQPQIPTITFVDDTFLNERERVRRDIATAKARFEARGRRT